jgi:hypothetical protein
MQVMEFIIARLTSWGSLIGLFPEGLPPIQNPAQPGMCHQQPAAWLLSAVTAETRHSLSMLIPLVPAVALVQAVSSDDNVPTDECVYLLNICAHVVSIAGCIETWQGRPVVWATWLAYPGRPRGLLRGLGLTGHSSICFR